MLSINTNVLSLTTQRNVSQTQSQLSTSIERLSSGLRINSAKDDAAGLAISERFTSQIRGANQAVRNANDGISLSQTAEGALSEASNNLQRVRELAVQAANATNSSSDRAALQAEASALLSEVNRVAEQTKFNGINLLDGSFSSQSFQVGADSGQTIDISSIVDSRTSQLGSNVLTSSGSDIDAVDTAASGVATNGIAQETDLTITTNAGTTSQFGYAADAGADAIADAINTNASSVGVTATATNSATLENLSASGNLTFNLNGQAVAVSVSDVNDLSNVVSAINGVSGTTGVTAEFTSDSAKDSITLSTTDGRNIRFEDFANDNGDQTIDFGGTTLDETGNVSAVKTGSVQLSSSEGPISLANADGNVFSATASSFNSVAALDISTATGASNALDTIDAALEQVNGGRADLGAVQSRFESVVANLQVTSENLSASRSRIQDADFAAETAALSRAQVLQQAGTAMLAQANSSSQNVLSLLR